MRSELARSKVTTQEQTSVPAEVRRAFGIQAGSELLWSLEDGRLVIELARRDGLEEARAALAPAQEAKPLSELKSGIRARMVRKHGRARG